MILPILAYGDPVLKKETEELAENDPILKTLIADMFETMYKAKGVGLAAPQIGKSIRLFIIDGSPFANEEGEEIVYNCDVRDEEWIDLDFNIDSLENYINEGISYINEGDDNFVNVEMKDWYLVISSVN